LIEKLRGLRLTKAAELVATAVEETLTYYAFPEERHIAGTAWSTKRCLNIELLKMRAAVTA
jgi:hypothetical protein